MEEKENISLEEKFINDITEFKENYIRMPRNSKAIENLFYVSNGIFYYPCLKFFSNLEKQLNELYYEKNGMITERNKLIDEIDCIEKEVLSMCNLKILQDTSVPNNLRREVDLYRTISDEHDNELFTYKLDISKQHHYLLKQVVEEVIAEITNHIVTKNDKLYQKLISELNDANDLKAHVINSKLSKLSNKIDLQFHARLNRIEEINKLKDALTKRQDEVNIKLTRINELNQKIYSFKEREIVDLKYETKTKSSLILGLEYSKLYFENIDYLLVMPDGARNVISGALREVCSYEEEAIVDDLYQNHDKNIITYQVCSNLFELFKKENANKDEDINDYWIEVNDSNLIEKFNKEKLTENFKKQNDVLLQNIFACKFKELPLNLKLEYYFKVNTLFNLIVKSGYNVTKTNLNEIGKLLESKWQEKNCLATKDNFSSINLIFQSENENTQEEVLDILGVIFAEKKKQNGLNGLNLF